jgi:hypothetical protein
MDNTEVRIKKIPLKPLMEILQDAWERGADYIDIVGTTADVQDNVIISIREEYMSEDNEEEEEKQPPKKQKRSKFQKEEEDDEEEDDDDDDDNQLTDDELNLLL